jgi:hypothetical protein
MIMHEEHFVQADEIETKYLDDTLEPGFFVSADNREAFVILQGDDSRWAVMVSDPACRGWRLEANAQNWRVLRYKNVILAADTSTIDVDGDYATPGSLIVKGSEVRMIFRPTNGHSAMSARWSGAPSSSEVPAIAFPRWCVALPDGVGGLKKLYTREVQSTK